MSLCLGAAIIGLAGYLAGHPRPALVGDIPVFVAFIGFIGVFVGVMISQAFKEW